MVAEHGQSHLCVRIHFIEQQVSVGKGGITSFAVMVCIGFSFCCIKPWLLSGTQLKNICFCNVLVFCCVFFFLLCFSANLNCTLILFSGYLIGSGFYF